MLALVNASPSCTAHSSTARGVGFVSPLLYDVASSPAEYAASFNDVTTGNNDVYGLDNGQVFPATPGYDLASGLGSPRLSGSGGTSGLAYYLCTAAAAAGSGGRPVVSDVSPSTGSVAGGERVTITGSGFEAGGRPVVAAHPGRERLAGGRRVQGDEPDVDHRDAASGRGHHAPDAKAPQDGAGPADVIVIVNGGAASAPGPSAVFQYVDTRARRHGAEPDRHEPLGRPRDQSRGGDDPRLGVHRRDQGHLRRRGARRGSPCSGPTR